MSLSAPPRRHYAECVSTNDLARAWATDPHDPAPDGALVTADFQTQGRGRRGRRWDASPGQSALMSFVVRPAATLADTWQFGLVAALAVANALESFKLSPRLKWPNDVLLNLSKVAGVLVEVISDTAIIGIGVNVNQEGFVQGDEYDTPPTSLRLLTGHEFAVGGVITAVSLALAQGMETYKHGGINPILAEWRARLAVGVPLEDGTFATWVTVDQEERANSV